MLCAYVAIIWKVNGKKSTEDARNPSGRELKLKSKFYFFAFLCLVKLKIFSIVLPVFVLHNRIFFLEIDGFGLSQVE